MNKRNISLWHFLNNGIVVLLKVQLQSFAKYLRRTVALMWNSRRFFQEIFSGTNKIFISGVGPSIRQLFYEIVRFSWYFLTSRDLKSQVVWQLVRQLVRQLVYTRLLLIITRCFTCGKSKICPTIKKSQNIMNMIVCKIFFCALSLY